jgi:hypothetical protein
MRELFHPTMPSVPTRLFAHLDMEAIFASRPFERKVA